MMPDRQGTLALVDAIHQAGTAPALWPEVAGAMQAHFPGCAFSLLVHGSQDADPIPFSAGWDPDVIRQYAEHFHTINPYPKLLEGVAPNQIVRASKVVDPDWRNAQPFYQEWQRPNGNFTHGASLTLARDAHTYMRLCYDVPHALRHAEGPAARLLARLGPHMRRALDVNARLTAAAHVAHDMQAMIDIVAGAALIVDNRRRIVALNARATGLIKRAHLLRSTPSGQIEFVHASTDGAFEQALCASTSVIELPPGIFLLKTEIDGRAATIPVHVLPLRTLGGLHAASRARALVIIEVPTATAAIPAETLQKLFGLSAAEARIAIRIAAGQEPAEIDQSRPRR